MNVLNTVTIYTALFNLINREAERYPVYVQFRLQ